MRGLEANFTRVQLNSVTATTPSTERGISFNVLASELIVSAVIRNSLTAKDDEGGLAGTVDLTTCRPLDHGKRTFNATLRGRLWANSLWEGKIKPVGGDIDALRHPDKVWEHFIRTGISMIQTDEPKALLRYTQARNQDLQ